MAEENTKFESFYGHLISGIFFIVLSIWWMYNLFSKFFRAKVHRHEFRCRLWFPTMKFPIESFCKVIFAFAMIVCETIFHYCGRSQENIFQLNSMYSVYLISAVIELLLYYGISLPQDFDYLTTIITYVFLGSSFSSQCSSQSTDLELCANTVLSRMLLVTSVAVLMQLLYRNNVTVALAFPMINVVIGVALCFEALLFYSPYKGVAPLLSLPEDSGKALSVIISYLIGWSSFIAVLVAISVFKYVEKTCICLRNRRKSMETEENSMLLVEQSPAVSDDF